MQTLMWVAGATLVALLLFTSLAWISMRRGGGGKTGLDPIDRFLGRRR